MTQLAFDQQQTAMSALLACMAACEHCASACLREDDVAMMAECIRLDRDCADVCALTARLLARGSRFGSELLPVCAQICQACAAECARHQHAHCQECAQACTRCAEECLRLAA